MWFDTDAARSAATSWTAWGDRLEIDSRTIRLRLDALQLQAWPGGSAELDLAGDELWQLAAFVHGVRAAVERADGGVPTTADAVAGSWALAGRLVGLAAEHRDAVADESAYERWLASLDPDSARALFASGGHDDPARALAALTGEAAVAYWDSLPASAQSDLVETRPDLVVLQVVAHGGDLAPGLLARLDTANSYQQFSEEFALEFEVAVNARIVTIEIGGGFTAITAKHSDGSVELTLVETADVGVGFDIDARGAASAGASLGVVAELHQRFRFGDEAEAAAAIDTLRDAVSQDASFGELVRDGAGLLWNGAVAPWNVPASVTNWLVPFVDPVPTIPTYDFTPETIRRLHDLWATNGVIRQEGIGVFASGNAEFEASLGLIDAEVEARLMFYDSDVAAADTTGEVGQTGVLFSGIASVTAAGDVAAPGLDATGRASAEAGFIVDLHHTDEDATYLSVTLMTSAAAGAMTELIDLEAVDLDVAVAGTAAMTLTYTVPVDAHTTGTVGEIGRELARGRLPIGELRQLYDAAEIDVLITSGTASELDAEFDAAVVEANVTVSSATEATQVALHKYPDGDLFSRIEVDRLIDRASE